MELKTKLNLQSNKTKIRIKKINNHTRLIRQINIKKIGKTIRDIKKLIDKKRIEIIKIEIISRINITIIRIIIGNRETNHNTVKIETDKINEVIITIEITRIKIIVTRRKRTIEGLDRKGEIRKIADRKRIEGITRGRIRAVSITRRIEIGETIMRKNVEVIIRRTDQDQEINILVAEK